MALIIFSFFASTLVASMLWLAVGSRFPWDKSRVKYPVANNIFLYTLLVFFPICMLVFSLH